MQSEELESGKEFLNKHVYLYNNPTIIHQHFANSVAYRLYCTSETLPSKAVLQNEANKEWKAIKHLPESEIQAIIAKQQELLKFPSQLQLTYDQTDTSPISAPDSPKGPQLPMRKGACDKGILGEKITSTPPITPLPRLSSKGPFNIYS